MPMKRGILLLISFIFIYHAAFTQNISRAFKNYLEGDFPKTLEILQKGHKADTADAAFNFGLAMVYSNPKFPDKDYFRAWKYMQVADANFNSMNEDEKKAMSEFLFSLEQYKSNKPIRQKFDVLRKDIENKLIKYVREENDMQMIDEFIRDFPGSRFYENVVHIRNYILYSKAANENTIDGYNQFIHDFPDAAQVPQAISRRNKLAFEQAKASGDLDRINAFLSQYPSADQCLDALNLRDQWAFEKAKKLNTIEGYDDFVKKYPNAVQVSTARKLQKQLVFEKAKQVNTFEAYAEFVRKYPEAEQFVDVFNLMADALGQRIIQESQFPMQHIDWLKAFDNYGKDDYASSLLVNPDGSLVFTGTTTDDSMNVAQAWIVKLDPLRKMVWTRNYGNRLGVSLSTAVYSPTGDIFAGGYARNNPVLQDSSSWFLKLNPQGLKYFDKTCPGKNIRTMTGLPGIGFAMAGTDADTAGRKHYWIQTAKETGKIVWNRTYSGFGEISSVKSDPNSRIYFAAGRWVVKTDANGYILWEYIPEPGDSLLALDVMKSGEVILAGLTGKKELLVEKLSALGKRAARFVFPTATGLDDVPCLRITATNDIYVAANGTDYSLCAKINDHGVWLEDYRFSSGGHSLIRDIALAPAGAPYLLMQNYRPATGSDIILLKLK